MLEESSDSVGYVQHFSGSLYFPSFSMMVVQGFFISSF